VRKGGGVSAKIFPWSHGKIKKAAESVGATVQEIEYDSDPDRGGWTVILEKDGKWADKGHATLQMTIDRIKNEEQFGWFEL
jgi:hypothetical protein